MKKIRFIDEVKIQNKKVLLRVDFNVSLNPNQTIADDFRIQRSLPTVNYLLSNGNKLVIISHLDRPKKRDDKLSLKPVAKRLQSYLKGYKVRLIGNFEKEKINNSDNKEVILLENIRFYPGELKNNQNFAKKLAKLGEVFVNDAFGVCHRVNASIVSLPKYLPSYGGLLLKKEIEMISKIINHPKKPTVAIIGGAKITTKIALINKLLSLANYLLIGGGLANTFLCAQGYNIGNSFCEYEKVEMAKKILFKAAQTHTAILLPSDAVLGKREENKTIVKNIEEIKDTDSLSILDIGPETQAKFGMAISHAKTIIWNGPVGYIENPVFKRGTDFIYYSITQNSQATSLVGGGDTLAAISKKEYLDKITHLSTGGGAMLEFIEKGELIGIEALKR